MRLFFTSMTIGGLLAALLPLSAQEPDAALRGSLERAYTNWRDAVIRKDARAWAASISRYRQTVMRNSIVSERKAFPDAVFATDMKPAPLDGLRLLEAEAVGETAHLVYFGKVDLGQDRELMQDNILKLKFLSEGGLWKFDSNRITSLNSVPEVLKALQAGRRPEFLDLPEYTPPGQAPAVPALCRVPDFKAGFKLQTFGYATTVGMNGFDYDSVQDGLSQEIITGGLVKGHNEITLTMKPVPVPEGEKASLQIRVYILSDDPEKPGTEVLRWQAPETGAPATVTLPIEVSR